MEYWIAMLLSIVVGIIGLIVIVLISGYIGQMTNIYFAAPFIMFFFVAVLGVIAYQYGLKKQVNISITLLDKEIENYTVEPEDDGSFNSDGFLYIHFPEDGSQGTIEFIGLVEKLAISKEIKLCRDYETTLLNKKTREKQIPISNVNICVRKKGFWK